MFFQCSPDLSMAPTKYLVLLSLECKDKPKADCYQCIISYDLDKRRDKVACDDTKWIKPKIIFEVDKVCVKDLQLEQVLTSPD